MKLRSLYLLVFALLSFTVQSNTVAFKSGNQHSSFSTAQITNNEVVCFSGFDDKAYLDQSPFLIDDEEDDNSEERKKSLPDDNGISINYHKSSLQKEAHFQGQHPYRSPFLHSFPSKYIFIRSIRV